MPPAPVHARRSATAETAFGADGSAARVVNARVVSGDENGGTNERGVGFQRRRGSPPPLELSATRRAISDPSRDVYVLHAVEPHHTLRGIAVQYRLTVDQLKRYNNLWTEEDLHSHRTVKIPTTRDGFLYNAVHETGGASFGAEMLGDQDSKLHTNMRAMPAEEESGEAFRVERHNPDAPVDSAQSSTTNSVDYLSRFDAELSQVLETQRRREEDADTDSTTVGLIGMPVRENRLWGNFYPSDWRVIVAVFILVAVVIPVAFYMLEPHVQAPPPHGTPAAEP